ncbi:alpha-tocopherol transfer protein-like isoform X2 [Diorhabda sublineata]|uniref:alpha-tocopherol transfer protein-like isoform X2 n=2 Tax=Diorhabda sublineata TaxID=1163346 RepID=UPI0024E1356C|nr:alpha-tocopherol transfer protein-like isoform X2 [Diorhabda sublineata]
MKHKILIMSLPYEFSAKEIILQGKTTKENIEVIKTWLLESGSDFVPTILCDELIVLFLLSCENNVENTKITITGHYEIKAGAPELFNNRNVSGADIQTVLDTWIITIFPVRGKNNNAIHYFQLEDDDVRKMDNIAFLKTILMLIDITQEKDPPDGFINIVDLKASRLRHVTKFKLDATKKYLTYIQEGLPIKLNAIHLINTKGFVIKLFNVLKACIRSELFDKIHFYPQNIPQEILETMAPKEGLPQEFGGDLPSLKELHQHTKKQFDQRQEYWIAEERIRKNCSHFHSKS